MIEPDNRNNAPVDINKTRFAPVAPRPESYSTPPAYSQPQSQPLYNYRPHRESAGRRLCKAFIFAIVIYGLISAALHATVHFAHIGHHSWGGQGSIINDWPELKNEVVDCQSFLRSEGAYSYDAADVDDEVQAAAAAAAPAVDQPNMYMPMHMLNFVNSIRDSFTASSGPATDSIPPYSSSLSFTLPVDADLLYFLSRGALAYGSVRIAPADPSELVKVDITMRYWTEAARSRAHICKLENGGEDGNHGRNSHGIGIFTPRRWEHRGYRDQIKFDVIIHLPILPPGAPGVSHNGAVRVIKELQTNFPNFVQDVEELQDLIAFQKLSLHSSNGRISSGSVYAEKGIITTSNGVISGTFNTSSVLELQTSNAKIEATVSMLNTDSHRPTVANLRTSNGVVVSSFMLYNSTGYAPSSALSAGSFHVTARTSNAGVILAVPTQPPNSILTLTGQASNGVSRLVLGAAFEGDFSLSTSNAMSLVDDRSEGVEDPAGLGRERHVDVRRVGPGGSVSGKVWWGDGNVGRGPTGYARLTSSNAPVTLELSPSV